VPEVPIDPHPRIYSEAAMIPHCRHHEKARMRLVPVEIPFFGLCSNARYKQILHTNRKCWRCTKKLLMEIDGELRLLPCPWVVPCESESGIAEWKRSQMSNARKNGAHYSEVVA
jgi:hypothetical protein